VTKLIVHGGGLRERHVFFAPDGLVDDAQREAVRIALARERVNGEPLVHIEHGPRCEL
jgi:hypothetical protein